MAPLAFLLGGGSKILCWRFGGRVEYRGIHFISPRFIFYIVYKTRSSGEIAIKWQEKRRKKIKWKGGKKRRIGNKMSRKKKVREENKARKRKFEKKKEINFYLPIYHCIYLSIYLSI